MVILCYFPNNISTHTVICQAKYCTSTLIKYSLWLDIFLRTEMLRTSSMNSMSSELSGDPQQLPTLAIQVWAAAVRGSGVDIEEVKNTLTF